MFFCTTCSTAADGDNMAKHLRATRHKSVRDAVRQELIACEECKDSNIHQLRVLRFGYNNMALLCQPCLDKEEKPAVQYSLENGSLLKKIGQYYTFRDAICSVCSSHSKLHVLKTGTKQQVVCRKCVAGALDKFPEARVIAEDDDDFLSELLGITPFVFFDKSDARRKSTRGRGREGGRRGGSGRGKPRGPAGAEQDKEAEKRREHYFNKLNETKSLKSGQTVSAVGQTSVKNGDSAKGKSDRGKAAGSKNGGSKSSAPKSSGFSKAAAFSKSNGSRKSAKSSPAGSNRESPVPSGISAPPASYSKGKSPKPTSTEKSKRVSQGKDSDASSDKKKEVKLPVKPKEGSKSITSKSKDSKSHNPKLKESAPTPQVMEQELPSGITKYEPSKTPKLTYESMQEYFRELSYNLFLEDKISAESYGGFTIEPEDMFLSWYQDLDKSHKQYKVEIELNDQFMSKLNRRKNLKFKRTIFSVRQTVYLVLDGTIPWYGEIALSETRRQFAKRQKMEIQELIIKLYPWNYSPLPKTVNVKRLTIIPASVPVSRTFLAMTRIENPKFKSMLLGHEPIKQISFNNYIKLTNEDRFNQSQKVALQSVLNNSITVLQGPPGTGKTSTIYEIILQLLSNLNTYPILVVAASNIAVDNIAEKLMKTHQVSLLRIVSMEKESDYKSDHKLNSICLHKKVYDMLPDNLKEVHYKLRGPRASEVSVTQYRKFMSTWIQYSDLIIPQARVIFTTSVAAGGNQLKSMRKVPVVIMDEATQSSEASTLIPLSMPGVEKFVFVGDQRQLSSFTQVPALSLSLFERVLLNGTYTKPQMLDTQYRMHPAISDFPRNKFYDGLLKDGISAEARSVPGVEKPVLFWDTNGKKPEDRIRVRVREDSGYTYVNRGEIDNIVEIVTDLIVTKNITKAEIGIITPYSGQRDLISATLTANELINPEKLEIKVEVDRDDIEYEAKPVTIHSVSDIMIASIDAFQGREKDFIIISCVRSNKEHKVGFLNDARRLNVALTRARCGLILVGDRATLAHDPLWREYIEHLESGQFVSDSARFEY